ncbi:hypothetical protein RN607_03230 [Demequina capsici]|uniref:Zinc-finger domain-containing protein n=1 Tax=Demequina capsici TaxID=3075620 RepID=A0AA96J8J9_9MICO|nr:MULTISPECIES: hypothetical protein [unclassified Demequina]WNM25123.1 hypothetical protein RN606_02960 [Demequina sp. OYTSA14]WNM28029.1 hypothetical protein RN607_03230 [Demequina sp. PMTSA13]
MTSRHLGRSIHDLLDGRLDAKATAEAMTHLAECGECATRYAELNEARERLHSSSAGIDISFAQQLLDRQRMAQIAAQEDPHRARAVRPPDRRPALLVLGALVAIVGGVGAAYVAGAPQTLSVEAASSGTAGDSASTVAYLQSQDLQQEDDLSGWADPFTSGSALLPIDASVVSLTDGTEGLIMTLVAHTDSVVVTEQHGRLASGYSELPTIALDGVTLYVVYGTPTLLVWETGGLVITASCAACEVSTLVDVAQAFPVAEEPGLVDRITAGLGELAGAVIGSD